MLVQLENILLSTFEDLILSPTERHQLTELANTLTEEQRRFLKNRAFDLCRPRLIEGEFSNSAEQRKQCYRWLEKTIKALSPADKNKQSDIDESLAYFSPGTECKNTIISCCRNAKKSIDICVFTISDNQITDSLLAAHSKGIRVRVISDNDKSEDRGSDIYHLLDKGVDVRMDNTKNHMHHKFAIMDSSILLNGSFNWTRSASERNEENLVRHDNPELTDMFMEKFEALWERYKA